MKRQIIEINEEKCNGCGLCIPSCSENALHLQLRSDPPKIFKDNESLYRNIYAESAVGLIGRK